MSKLDSSCSRMICGNLRPGLQGESAGPRVCSAVFVRLEIAALDELVDSLNAGPCEFRHVVSAAEILGKMCRKGHRERYESAHATGAAD